MKFYFKLIGRLPVPCDSIEEYLMWLIKETIDGTDPCRVGLTNLAEDCMISTVFLGINHNFSSSSDELLYPLLFETMTFVGGSPDDCRRCSTWDEAERQHQMAVEVAREKVAQQNAFVKAATQLINSPQSSKPPDNA